MNEKEKTLKRKMEQKLKEYMKKDVSDIDILRQEIYTQYPLKYPGEVFNDTKKDQPFDINTLCQYEMTQHFIQGDIP